MTANRWAVLAAVTAAAISVIIVLGWTTGRINHQPTHRHLNHLDPAPADHGWTTPSQPGPTP